MTIDHTGHASKGCTDFDLINIKLTRRIEPFEYNQNALMGIRLRCQECDKEWGAIVGGWRLTPTGVFCDQCAEADE